MDDNLARETILELLQKGYKIRSKQHKMSADPNSNTKWEIIMEKNKEEKKISLEKELSLDEMIELNRIYGK